MKKIIQIITRLDRGGSAENVLSTCEKLNKDRFELILIHGKSADGNLSCSRRLNGDYRIFCVPELVREISPVYDLIALWKIYKIIKKEKPSIVHTHSSKAGILGRWATWFYNLRFKISDLKLFKTNSQIINHKSKIIHTPHGHVFYGYYGKLKSFLFVLIERFSAKITDNLVALTEGEKNESLSFGIGKPQQWTVIHSGVEMTEDRGKVSEKKLQTINHELRTTFGISENAIVIGTVARLEPVKGIRYFIDAINIILQSPIPYPLSPVFLIVGDGSEMESLKLKIKSLNLEEKVIFTGMRDDVMDLISAMDIYVQPSLNEGMGKTIVQAMMLKKPIIATNVQGIPDLIKDNITGILVPPKNPEAIANMVLKLISDKDLRNRLGENAKNFISETADGYPKFSIERMIYLLEKLYD